MQGQITLSKKEKQYQFFYLILMLLAALIFLGIIFLKRFKSPFSEDDIISIQKLEQKAKFDQQQKVTLKLLDSTFVKITRLKDETTEPFVENDIQTGILDIDNVFGNDFIDIRKESYSQISLFYKMYFDDKKIISTTSEDIKLFEKKYQECMIGLKDKKDRVFQRENALKARSQ
ncbi:MULTISPECIES: type VI secretion system TssO [Chryseobacterium]|uniref:type VI secretion system TssO n=1 Tax=Chryseobacterium TaxID=59732 RepID=UPI001BE74E25|nr:MULTISPECIES: type VI secretion system TssO [Chryseobacterium]MBT2621181.1 type VI secretion system transmembrane protein TssO [Chryseobacterium sp. ISL-6]